MTFEAYLLDDSERDGEFFHLLTPADLSDFGTYPTWDDAIVASGMKVKSMRRAELNRMTDPVKRPLLWRSWGANKNHWMDAADQVVSFFKRTRLYNGERIVVLDQRYKIIRECQATI